MTAILSYETLKAEFDHNLVTQLRGHSSGSEYLETWVPDENPVMSILNMVEAALSSGCKDVLVRFTEATMNESQRKALLVAVNEIADANLKGTPDGFELAVFKAQE